METCTNCERGIGNLEPAHIWQDRVVCEGCYRKLVPVAAPAIAPFSYRAIYVGPNGIHNGQQVIHFSRIHALEANPHEGLFLPAMSFGVIVHGVYDPIGEFTFPTPHLASSFMQTIINYMGTVNIIKREKTAWWGISF